MNVDDYRKVARKSKKSALEDRFEQQLRTLKGIPPHVRELRFAPGRKWRFDFAWPFLRLAVEIDGGEWSGGAHSRGEGMVIDCEKRAHALLLGWRVLRVVGTQVRNGEALAWTEQLLRQVPAHLTGSTEDRARLFAAEQTEIGS